MESGVERGDSKIVKNSGISTVPWKQVCDPINDGKRKRKNWILAFFALKYASQVPTGRRSKMFPFNDKTVWREESGSTLAGAR